MGPLRVCLVQIDADVLEMMVLAGTQYASVELPRHVYALLEDGEALVLHFLSDFGAQISTRTLAAAETLSQTMAGAQGTVNALAAILQDFVLLIDRMVTAVQQVRVPHRLATSVRQLRHDQMEQGPTELHAGRSTFLLSLGGAGWAGPYRVLRWRGQCFFATHHWHVCFAWDLWGRTRGINVWAAVARSGAGITLQKPRRAVKVGSGTESHAFHYCSTLPFFGRRSASPLLSFLRHPATPPGHFLVDRFSFH